MQIKTLIRFKYILIFLVMVLLLLLLKSNYLDTEFTIINHTNYPIVYNNYEYEEREGEEKDYDFTSSEYKSFKSYYSIPNGNSAITRVAKKYWISLLPFGVVIDVRYQGKYLTEYNRNSLVGVGFKRYPTSNNQKAYCSYQIDVYPNRKTVVTPTDKKFCLKPLYLYTAE